MSKFTVTVTDNTISVVSIGVQGPAGPTGFGIPTGGTTNQFLVKASDTDYDMQWSASGVIINELNEIGDVNIPTPGDGDVLSWDNGTSKWINVTPTDNDVAAVWGNITGTLSNQTDLQTALDGKEPTFSKNTAFNKNFGSTTATVCEGDDARLSDDRTPTAHTHVKVDITDSDWISGITAEPIGDLSDVTNTTPADKHVLVFDGVTDNKYENRLLIETDISDFGTYETAFSKNTAFNKNFGSATTTVCEGDDSRLSDARTPTAHTHVKVDITDSDWISNIISEPIGDLSDVTNTTPADKHVLVFDGGSPSGYVNRLLVETDISDLGSYEPANANIQSHISDGTKHRIINDSGTSATELWSASKINTELGTKSSTSHTHALDDLTDVTNTTPTAGEVLVATGSPATYANRLLVEADISDLGTYLTDVILDTTPQLGGNLDVNGKVINSISNGDVTITPNGTGKTKITNIEAPLDINTQTGTTYTGVIADAEKMITLNNAAAITITIPNNSSVAYPVGTKLNFLQLGAGQVTIAADTGSPSDSVDVDATLTLKLNGQYAAATAFKVTTTSWVVFGNLEAA